MTTQLFSQPEFDLAIQRGTPMYIEWPNGENASMSWLAVVEAGGQYLKEQKQLAWQTMVGSRLDLIEARLTEIIALLTQISEALKGLPDAVVHAQARNAIRTSGADIVGMLVEVGDTTPTANNRNYVRERLLLLGSGMRTIQEGAAEGGYFSYEAARSAFAYACLAFRIGYANKPKDPDGVTKEQVRIIAAAVRDYFKAACDPGVTNSLAAIRDATLAKARIEFERMKVFLGPDNQGVVFCISGTRQRIIDEPGRARDERLFQYAPGDNYARCSRKTGDPTQPDSVNWFPTNMNAIVDNVNGIPNAPGLDTGIEPHEEAKAMGHFNRQFDGPKEAFQGYRKRAVELARIINELNADADFLTNWLNDPANPKIR